MLVLVTYERAGSYEGLVMSSGQSVNACCLPDCCLVDLAIFAAFNVTYFLPLFPSFPQPP